MLRDMRLIPCGLLLVDPEIDIGRMTNPSGEAIVEISEVESDNTRAKVVSI